MRGVGEAPLAVVAENGGSEAAECDVRRDLGSVKGASLVICQVWQG